MWVLFGSFSCSPIYTNWIYTMRHVLLSKSTTKHQQNLDCIYDTHDLFMVIGRACLLMSFLNT